MHNHFHEQIDEGLKSLSEKQGKDGLPASPPPGGAKNADGTAEPDLSALSDIDAANKEADADEAEVADAAKGS